MMFALLNYVTSYSIQIGLADAEIRVSSLPLKIKQLAALLFEPSIGNPLEFLNPLSLRDRSREAAQQVDVILSSANPDRRTLELPRDRAQVGVKTFPKRWIAQKGTALFC